MRVRRESPRELRRRHVITAAVTRTRLTPADHALITAARALPADPDTARRLLAIIDRLTGQENDHG